MVYIVVIDTTNIRLFCQAQIALNVQEIPIIISKKYLDYINIFLNSTIELFKPTNTPILFFYKKDNNF